MPAMSALKPNRLSSFGLILGLLATAALLFFWNTTGSAVHADKMPSPNVEVLATVGLVDQAVDLYRRSCDALADAGLVAER